MWAVELRRVWDAVEACRGLSGCVARRYKGDASFSGQAASTMRPGMARLCPGLYCTHKKGRHSLVHLRFDNRGMLVAMSREEKAARATGRARPALLSASMSYILARADAYDAIREDASFNAWVDMVGGVDGVCLRGSWLHGLNHWDSDCDLLVVGASVDDKVRAVNVHAGGVDALCVTAGRFARLLAGSHACSLVPIRCVLRRATMVVCCGVMVRWVAPWWRVCVFRCLCWWRIIVVRLRVTGLRSRLGAASCVGW